MTDNAPTTVRAPSPWTRITPDQAARISAALTREVHAGNRAHPARTVCDSDGRWTANAAAIALLTIGVNMVVDWLLSLHSRPHGDNA